jgi:16S rRNA (guanine527-N7)-methyltransferase
VLPPDARERVTALLETARDRGFVGPGPATFHVEHAEKLAEAVGAGFAGRFLDLGSGAGVPGLTLVLAWPAATGTLLDSQRRRCRFLEEALRAIEAADRATVACGRAEELARQPDFRRAFDLVVARGFGAPATTAECAVGFLGAGGRLVVSEPPDEGSKDRWSPDGLAELGLSGPELVGEEGVRFAAFRRVGHVSDRWPRRTGVPAKRPLWG